MFKLVTIFATLCLICVTQAGIITTNHVIHEPSLVNVGQVVHSGPSAVSHQSITQVHGKSHIVQPILAPFVKTSVHAAPIVVKTVEPVIPVVKTIHTPVVHTYATGPVIHSLPLVHPAAPFVTVQQN